MFFEKLGLIQYFGFTSYLQFTQYFEQNLGIY